MTSKERYLAVIRGDNPDFLPRIPILMRYAAEHIGSDYGTFASDFSVLVESNIKCAEEFGLDQLSAISDPYRETAAFGGEIIFHRDTGPECKTPPFADMEGELEELADIKIPNPMEHERTKDRILAIESYRQLTGDQYSLMGWVEGPAALACDLRGMSDMLMDMMDEPEWSEKLLDICVETSLAFAKAQIEAGADTIGIGDAVCSQISPAIFNELVFPRQERLIKGIKEMGALVRLHICGQTEHLWPKIATTPIDIFDCDHMVDMIKARAAFPQNVVLAGNLDPVADLRFGQEADVRSKVKKCYREVGKPYMVCAGCEIPSGTPVENVKAFCKPIFDRHKRLP